MLKVESFRGFKMCCGDLVAERGKRDTAKSKIGALLLMTVVVHNDCICYNCHLLQQSETTDCHPFVRTITSCLR